MKGRIAVALLFLASAQAHAQRADAGPRWKGFFGCWTIAQSGDTPDSQRDARIVCVTPTDHPDIADIVTIAGGKVAQTTHVDARGTAVPVSLDGCSGSERTIWSGDERRVYLESMLSCEGKVIKVRGILAVTPGGEWIDVRTTNTGTDSSVRVARYRDVGLPDVVPAEIANELIARRMSIELGRLAAGAPIGAAAIIEATKLLAPRLVEAWISESGQHFALTDREWRELAEAGIPRNVTDAIDASGQPQPIVESPNLDLLGRTASDYWDQGTGMRRVFPATPYDPWGIGIVILGRRYGYGQLGPSVVDGDGFAYFGDGYAYWFRQRQTVTGYVRPRVLVLHADQGAAAGGLGEAVAAAVVKDVVDAVAANGKASAGSSPTTQSGPIKSPQAPAASGTSKGKPR